jgi:hypothetical protein
MVFKFVKICRSLYLVDLYCDGIDYLEAVYALRLISLDSHSTGALSSLDSRNCHLDSDGPITFDLRSGVSVQWYFYGLDFVVSSSLKVDECLLSMGLEVDLF